MRRQVVELIERDNIRETMSLRWTVNGGCALRVMPLGGSLDMLAGKGLKNLH